MPVVGARSAGVKAAAAAAPAIAFVGATSDGFAAVSGNNRVAPLPTGVEENDFIVLLIEVAGAVTTTTPTGYTAIVTEAGGTDHRFNLFVKKAGAAESGPTITHASGQVVVYSSAVFRNVDVSDVPNNSWRAAASTATDGQTTTNNAVVPSLVTTADNAMAVATFGVNSPQSWDGDDTGFPATWTGADKTGHAGCGSGIAYKAMPTAGATGTATFTFGASNDRWDAAMLALKKAA